MANILDQFRVRSLQPEQREHGDVYQLNTTSVSPTRIVGTTENGEPIEETICALGKVSIMVDKDGNILDVPLRTGRVLSHEPEAVRYEMIVIKESVLGGMFPLECCPHTKDYATFTGYRGPLVPGGVDCGGKPGATKLEEACDHMQALVKKRRAAALAKYQKGERELAQMNEVGAKKMLGMFADMIEAAADHKATDVKAGRSRLIKGEGDKDETR